MYLLLILNAGFNIMMVLFPWMFVFRSQERLQRTCERIFVAFSIIDYKILFLDLDLTNNCTIRLKICPKIKFLLD